MPGVFLSYRRIERNRPDRLARNLANRFGSDLIFQDVEDIAGGQRWRRRIREAIEGAEVVLVAIGPDWLVDKEGRRRLDEPDDVARAELVEASFRSTTTHETSEATAAPDPPVELRPRVEVQVRSRRYRIPQAASAGAARGAIRHVIRIRNT